MLIQDMNIRIRDIFSKDIDKWEIRNENELYLSVNPKRIQDICVYLNDKAGCNLISLFASDERKFLSDISELADIEEKLSGKFVLRYVFAHNPDGLLIVLSVEIDPAVQAFQSITRRIPAASFYEREIKDLFGLTPEDHPDAKPLVFHHNWPENHFPLRKDFNADFRPDFVQRPIDFRTIHGEGIFEIPVGPVHAGIIEPGHFRFSLAGEPILNLEAQLFFVHKGIEKKCEGMSIERAFYMAERISGDETFANSLAYCQAIEKIAGVKAPKRAEYSRVLFAELERLTSHFGDLAGICTDVAYHFAGSQFNMLRNMAYGMADILCGMRFLRSANRPGGMRSDFILGKEQLLSEQLNKIENELQDTMNIILHNSMFIDRVENTGILNNKIAIDLNAVGPGGRASGVPYDVRKSFPYAAYANLNFKVPVLKDGDVSSRMKVKLQECVESISLIRQVIEDMPTGKIIEPIGTLDAYRYAFGMTELPRGENLHWIMTGEKNTIFRYKVRTPSFCNWPALCHAVQGNIVPDFPLINKSFNLSYAGNDL